MGNVMDLAFLEYPSAYLTPDGKVKPAISALIDDPAGSSIPKVITMPATAISAQTSTWTDADWLNAHRKANQQLAEQVGRLTNLLQDAWRERDQALALAAETRGHLNAARQAALAEGVEKDEALAEVERLKGDHASAIRQLTGQEEGSVG